VIKGATIDGFGIRWQRELYGMLIQRSLRRIRQNDFPYFDGLTGFLWPCLVPFYTDNAGCDDHSDQQNFPGGF
jgi:hypothetical protein